jgi:hypothetical protein
LKYAASTECLKKENYIQQKQISLQEEKLKVLVEDRRVLVEDRRQLCGEKRSLEKEYHARLKEVGEDSPTLKIELTEENRLLRKSYNAEVKKRGLLEARSEQLEAKSVRDDDKITRLKRDNNQLMLDIRQERQASNLLIDKAMVEARWLSADALEMMVNANEKIITERNQADEMQITERNKAAARLHEERAHHSRESERLRQKQAVSIEKLS